ncbi:MAG: DUF3019 domain-containing protein [Granulosicoccus sp.]
MLRLFSVFLKSCALALLLVASASNADEKLKALTLLAKPTSCVALHRGQMCFQEIRFTWESDSSNSYCLYQNGIETALYCSRSAKNSYIHKYASESFQTFSLLEADSGITLSTVKINTAWVYRTGRRSSSGWRLF